MIMYDDRGLERFAVDADSNDTCIKLWDTGTQHYAPWSSSRICCQRSGVISSRTPVVRQNSGRLWNQ